MSDHTTDATTATPASGDLDARLAELPPFISVAQAGELLGLSRVTAYRYAKSGHLPVKRFGPRRMRVVTAQLRRWLDSTDSTAAGTGESA